MIKDSGMPRREFESGAVRDIQEGKGRCDLLPLGVIGVYIVADGTGLEFIDKFKTTGDPNDLRMPLALFCEKRGWNVYTMLLEVAKHFEEGCKKYGENNWQKGIPVRCYIDSAVRHYLKWLRGDTDESHDRAFCWNILCCIWTCVHKPELNDYARSVNRDDAS